MKKILVYFILSILLISGCTGEKPIEISAFFSVNDSGLSIENTKLLFYASEKLEIENNEHLSKDFWTKIVDKKNKTTYADYQKEVIFFENIKNLCGLSAMYLTEYSLEEDENNYIRQLAADYYSSMDAGDIELLNISEDDITELFQMYYKAMYVKSIYISNWHSQVSEEEYRVCLVERLMFENSSDASYYFDEYKQNPDELRDELITDTVIMNIDKSSDLPDAELTSIFSLDNDQLSTPFTNSEGYYIYKILNKFDTDLSMQRKENILNAQKKASWQTACSKFLSTARIIYNDAEWKELEYSSNDSYSLQLSEIFDFLSKLEDYSLTKVTPSSEGTATSE